MAFRPAWTRIAAGCGATVALLCTLASAQGLPGAASLRGAGTSGVVDLAVQAGASLAGAGVITGSTSRRMLHFTFDDGPDRWHTPKLLDTLDRTGHKATFFFSTSRFTGDLPRHDFAPGLAREIARRGHRIGSHGYDHIRMSKLRPPAVRAQIDQSEALFIRVFGVRPYVFRPPFGSRNAAVDTRLAEGGYATVMWNIGMADWNAQPAEDIVRTFFRTLERNEADRGERGGIVLLHDTHAWGVEAYALIAAQLATRNCALLAAGEELYDVTESLDPFVHPPADLQHAARQSALRERLSLRCRRPSTRPCPGAPGTDGNYTSFCGSGRRHSRASPLL
jgi:peptidoglycan/xylan/chitin deacetylase (PgdA/CDA1 family)